MVRRINSNLDISSEEDDYGMNDDPAGQREVSGHHRRRRCGQGR